MLDNCTAGLHDMYTGNHNHEEEYIKIKDTQSSEIYALIMGWAQCTGETLETWEWGTGQWCW